MRRLADDAAAQLRPLGSQDAVAPLTDILGYIIERTY